MGEECIHGPALGYEYERNRQDHALRENGAGGTVAEVVYRLLVVEGDVVGYGGRKGQGSTWEGQAFCRQLAKFGEMPRSRIGRPIDECRSFESRGCAWVISL